MNTKRIKMILDFPMGRRMFKEGETYNVSEFVYLYLVDKEGVAIEDY